MQCGYNATRKNYAIWTLIWWNYLHHIVNKALFVNYWNISNQNTGLNKGCSLEVVDLQNFRDKFCNDESIAREGPSLYLHAWESPITRLTRGSVMKHSVFLELSARHAQRHDGMRVFVNIVLGNKQLVSAEQKPRALEELDARKELEAQRIWFETIERHRIEEWECDKRVAVAMSAREFEDGIIYSNSARRMQCVSFHHVEHIQRSSPSSSFEQYMRVAQRYVYIWQICKLCWESCDFKQKLEECRRSDISHQWVLFSGLKRSTIVSLFTSNTTLPTFPNAGKAEAESSCVVFSDKGTTRKPERSSKSSLSTQIPFTWSRPNRAYGMLIWWINDSLCAAANFTLAATAH